MCHHRRVQTVTVLWWTLLFLCLWFSAASAHQAPCHRLHSCPSDHGSYTCGDRGRCDQCPENQFCLAGKPRITSSQPPAPAPPALSPSATTTPSTVIVCFTPGENCTDAIVQALDTAKRTVLVQAYSFTSAPIAQVLLDAHKRGVQVLVILDKSQRTERYSSANFLANQGGPTTIDANHAISHNKVMIIDGETVITGSFNFTKACAGKKRGERAHHPRFGPGRPVHPELGRPSPA